MNLRNINLDQRQDFRKVPDKFAFLQLEGDDGGTVLDVSEGGLRFETFAPVQQNGPIHFWFSLNLRERIEAWGEVVWTSATKKCGGLRFLRLSEEGRALVRECISQPSVQEVPIGGFSRLGAAKEMPARMGAREADSIARFVSKAHPREEATSAGHAVPRAWETPAENPPPRAPLPSSSGTADAVTRFVSKARPRQETASDERAMPGAWETPAENPPPRAPLPSFSGTADAGDTSILFPTPKETEADRGLVPMQRYRSAKRRQLRLGLILGVCISATVAAAAVKYSRHENRGVLNAPAELRVQKSLEDSSKPVPTNPSVPSGTSADIFGSGNQKRHVAEARAPIVPTTGTGGHSSPRAWEATASNLPARTPVQPNLGGNASRQKPAMTPQQLWGSVQAGNTKAAVELADLYVKGQGVPQNCNQARVLLLVASEKRNAEAIKKLAELDKTGCSSN